MMEFGKMTMRDISILEVFIVFVIAAIEGVVAYRHADVYRLALDTGDYTGAGIGLFVLYCPILVGIMAVVLIIVTDKLCISIEGDNE